MKTRIFLAGMMAAALLSSCSQDEVVEALDMNQAIGFSTYVGTQTKGTVTDDNGTTGIQETGFGVLASYTGQSDFSNQTPNFMYNQLVTCNNQSNPVTWTYSPLKYWPTTSDDKISFFAYAPYDDNNTDKGIVLSANTALGAPTITFTVKDDAANMVDFVADVQMNRSHLSDNHTGTDQDTDGVNESEVKFIFKHELTRVSFNAKVDERIALSANTSSSPTRVVIKDVQLKGDNTTNVFYKSATYTFASTNTGDVRGTWSYADNGLQSSNYGLSSILNKVELPNGFLTSGIANDDKYNSETDYKGIWLSPVGNESTSLFSTGQYLFLIPVPDVDGTDSRKLIAEITYDIITADANLAKGYSITRAVKNVDLPLQTIVNTTKTDFFRQGKSNVFTFIIGIDEIKVSASVSGWDTDLENNTDVEYENTDVTP